MIQTAQINHYACFEYFKRSLGMFANLSMLRAVPQLVLSLENGHFSPRNHSFDKKSYLWRYHICYHLDRKNQEKCKFSYFQYFVPNCFY